MTTLGPPPSYAEAVSSAVDVKRKETKAVSPAATSAPAEKRIWQQQIVEPKQLVGNMKSTWWRTPANTFAEELLTRLQPHTLPQVGPRKGKLPVFTPAQQLRWMAPQFIAPILIPWLSRRYGLRWPKWAMVAFSTTHWLRFAGNVVHLFVKLGHKWGYFDGTKPRDKVPDSAVQHLAFVYPSVAVARMLIGVLLIYKPRDPVRLTALLPVKAFLYSIVLDLFFYTYHRSCHEVEWLWKIHSTHHLTKRPSPILALLADEGQEIIEVLLCPLGATFIMQKLLPMTYQEWYLTQLMVVFNEIAGHSGLRAYVEASVTSIPLKPFGAALALEDHDMHHRRGWKKATNYGKQSLLWDRIFGTKGVRLESQPENVDFNLSVWDEVPPELDL
ncbi:hypothetical protein CF319_g6129 [Tilletia indica]|uniref:Uncharacterized protein n=1 Tax=Tilletia indica TaxID=43049 RepID=A0A177TDJ0_9BASI|nr:hypothetical protein CF319_g6129 [Tilletia indica]KAE8231067.1 hypothetical protein CF326_g3921 [Tilletia indica]KAE8259017.1 hypothetical protein A4X13_0g1283 [Tilletia indica]